MTVLDETTSRGARLGVGISIGDASLDVVLETVRAAEDAGLDSVSVGDGKAGPESFTMLSAVAMVTARIGLVSSVAGWVRSPAITAQLTHTISALSNGRMTVGIGPLPRARVVDWHGLPFDPVMPRFREYVLALAECLDADEEHPTSFAGEYYSTHGFVGPSFDRIRRSPLVLAATQQRMTELAGELTDGVIFNGMLPLGFLAGAGRDHLRAGLAKAGRAPGSFTVGAGRLNGISENRDEAYDLARRSMTTYMEVPYFHKVMGAQGFGAELEQGLRATRDKDFAGMVNSVSDEMVDAVAIAGTPDEALEKLRRYEGVVDWISLGGGPLTVPKAQRLAQTHLVIDILKELKNSPRPSA